MIRSDRRPRVIVMTRLPVAGHAKTRLGAAIGLVEAAEAQSFMGRLLCTRLRALEATREAHVDVRFTGGTRTEARRWLGSGVHLRRQDDGDLGRRLHAALRRALKRDASAAIVVGSDCPDLAPEHVREALRLLASDSDVVVGPAVDGGYWLLGVRAQRVPQLSALFEAIAWGSADVLQQTVEAARNIRANVGFLPVLADVDRAEDLPLLENARADDRRVRHPGSLAVVIPTLNEAETIANAVAAALLSGADEVIVADGGSADATRKRAAEAGARVVTAPAGRALQMNAGAAEADSDALLFVHADCTLPPDAAAAALQALRSGAIAGAFSFGTDSTRWSDGWAASAGRLRHRITGHAYGDQGLFLSARTFNDLGGFPPIPVMEDWEMMRRLRRMGTVRILPLVLPSSARGWQRHGLVRSALVNATVIAGYRLGVQPARLAALRRLVAMR